MISTRHYGTMSTDRTDANTYYYLRNYFRTAWSDVAFQSSEPL